MRIGRILLVLALIVGMLFPRVWAVNPVDELQQQMDELRHLRQLSEQATAPLEEELENLNNRISSIKFQLAEADNKTAELETSIEDREGDLVDQYVVLSKRVRSYYKLSRQGSPLMLILATTSASELSRQLSYRAAVADEDRAVIVKITEEIVGLEQDKKDLDARKIVLGGLREQFEKEAAFFEGEIAGAKDYQAELSGKIAELSARQQEILAEKSGTFQTTVGEVPLADDPASRPDYNPGFSPAYAAFSFGAPHYKGMSQYGALGRAKSGQSMDEILKAYYGDVRVETVDTNFSLPTTVGSLPFEGNYLKGIAEMPSRWADEGGYEALKAQAVAARSYALAYTGWRMGDRTAKSPICITEQCQVYNSGKAGNPGRWGEAVNDTKGKILVGNGSGEVVNSWYASTSGGYQESYSSLGHTTPAFWDTPSGRSGWTSQAWEKVSGSPWFYKGWYKSRSGDNCGRSHPWLTSEEMADVLNAWVVLIKHGQADDRVTPQGSCWGGNPYSNSELRDKASGLSVGYSSVQGVAVTYSESGVTAKVTFETDKESVTINGLDFKKAFNLRAPGRIALKSGLFNIEKK